MDELPVGAHDRWLAAYSVSQTEVFCANRDCPNHEGATVTLTSEYGQSWLEPEECWLCLGAWLDDKPEDDDEEEEEEE